MNFQLIGYSHFSFTNDNGQFVSGYKFHVSRPSNKRNFVGNEVAALTVSEEVVKTCGEPRVGSAYHATYDQSGKLIGYALYDPQQTKIPKT